MPVTEVLSKDIKPGFVDKLIQRIGKVGTDEVKNNLIRLVEQKAAYERVFEVLQEGVIVTDGEGRITYLNPAACRFFALDQEAAAGELVYDKIRGLDWHALTHRRRVVSRDMEVYYPENRILNFYVAPLETHHGEGEASGIAGDGTGEDETLGFVILLRDATRTRKVTEKKIESERLSALTLLAAGVAHELGNPLNSLNIHLQLIERKLRKQAPEAYDGMKDLLEVARGEINRLDFIIEQFLGAIRPTVPKFELADVGPLVRESVDFLRMELQDRGISVKAELRSGLPLLELDVTQVKQAFYNVIRNASQAMKSGGELTVQTDLSDDFVKVSFMDSGVGISAEHMGSVFQPYFTTRRSGTGLGLLIVRRIVREHGGEIELESEEGKGTRVTLYFPLLQRQTRLLESGKSEGEV